jgi:hypothetical protein
LSGGRVRWSGFFRCWLSFKFSHRKQSDLRSDGTLVA